MSYQMRLHRHDHDLLMITSQGSYGLQASKQHMSAQVSWKWGCDSLQSSRFAQPHCSSSMRFHRCIFGTLYFELSIYLLPFHILVLVTLLLIPTSFHSSQSGSGRGVADFVELVLESSTFSTSWHWSLRCWVASIFKRMLWVAPVLLHHNTE